LFIRDLNKIDAVVRTKQFFRDRPGEIRLETFDLTGARILVSHAGNIKSDAGDKSSSRLKGLHRVPLERVM
jgi:hypothetical protein